MRGLAVEELRQIENFGGLVDLLLDLLLRQFCQLERESDVLADVHVRVQRVGLKHHGDIAVLRSDIVHALAVDEQVTFGDVLQPCNHVQHRRLTATGGADEDDELAVVDFEIRVFHTDVTIRKALVHVL